MHTAFLVLIIVVLSASLLFGLVIWFQTIKFQEKAAVAKVRQEEYLRLLRIEKEEENRRQEAEMLEQGLEESGASTDKND